MRIKIFAFHLNKYFLRLWNDVLIRLLLVDFDFIKKSRVIDFSLFRIINGAYDGPQQLGPAHCLSGLTLGPEYFFGPSFVSRPQAAWHVQGSNGNKYG